MNNVQVSSPLKNSQVEMHRDKIKKTRFPHNYRVKSENCFLSRSENNFNRNLKLQKPTRQM